MKNITNQEYLMRNESNAAKNRRITRMQMLKTANNTEESCKFSLEYLLVSKVIELVIKVQIKNFKSI